MDPTSNRVPLKHSSLQSSEQASLKSNSSCSILSDSFVKLKANEEIKQSVVRSIDKTVITWTPVVLSSANTATVAKTKLQYNTATTLNSGVAPAITKKLKGGVIIKLPVDDTDSEAHEAVQA